MKAKRLSEAKMAQRSSYIILYFLSMWLPLPIIVGISYAILNSDEASFYESLCSTLLQVQLCSFLTSTMSATFNPIIYGLAIRTFRKAFVRVSRKYWKRLKRK